ncbi:hypothetical protein JNB88_30680 [Rhizobium cauense]|nr:hypothetical protein [Rhizobium cauense]MBW9117985.1 hypothetical protein [Rhizobium cauense]
MEIQGMYAALATTDIKRAEEFYSFLFGRELDNRPSRQIGVKLKATSMQ